MSRLSFALVLVPLLVAAIAYAQAPGALSAPVAAAPALQATASSVAAPTPAVSSTPQAAAPISDSTQQVLLILAFVALSVVLIGGGIYLRRRWIATRY